MMPDWRATFKNQTSPRSSSLLCPQARVQIQQSSRFLSNVENFLLLQQASSHVESHIEGGFVVLAFHISWRSQEVLDH